MNLYEYAEHRRDSGLSGATHVAVLKAIRRGCLGDAARQVEGKWIIGHERADIMWAATTNPTRGKPAGGNTGGRPPANQTEANRTPPDTADAAPRPRHAHTYRPQAVPDAGGTAAKLHAKLSEAASITVVSKALISQADAKLRDLDLKTREGKLIEAEPVRRAVSTMIIKARNELIRIPRELRDRLAQTTDAIEIEGLLEDRIKRALSNLSEFDVIRG